MKKLLQLIIVLSLIAGFIGLIGPDVYAEDDAQSPAGTPGAAFPVFNSGGPIKFVEVKTENVSTTITEAVNGNAFVQLPNATLTYTVPAGTTDLLLVTFSGECRLSNGTSSDDWVQLEVRLNGVPMQPSDPISPMAFCSTDSWNMHSATFARRVPAGVYTLKVFWKLVDFAPLAPDLHGWLDDWTLMLQVAD
ncbi:MAG: hypothetical protein PH343_02595 [Nitrospira sp.]|nr:hypothetical protein [Nitrospira sp.]